MRSQRKSCIFLFYRCSLQLTSSPNAQKILAGAIDSLMIFGHATTAILNRCMARKFERRMVCLYDTCLHHVVRYQDVGSCCGAPSGQISVSGETNNFSGEEEEGMWTERKKSFASEVASARPSYTQTKIINHLT